MSGIQNMKNIPYNEIKLGDSVTLNSTVAQTGIVLPALLSGDAAIFICNLGSGQIFVPNPVQ